MLTSAWLNELTSSNDRCLAVVQAIDYITRLVEVHDQASQTLLGGKCMSLLGSISSDKGRRAVQVALIANWNSPLILHSDNGGSMKGATMLATLQKLGVMASLSRPAVSNDNPYSESLFKTLKYRPAHPLKAFPDIAAARTWATTLIEWYNHDHRLIAYPEHGTARGIVDEYAAYVRLARQLVFDDLGSRRIQASDAICAHSSRPHFAILVGHRIIRSHPRRRQLPLFELRSAGIEHGDPIGSPLSEPQSVMRVHAPAARA
jgi:hypothetical protein